MPVLGLTSSLHVPHRILRGRCGRSARALHDPWMDPIFESSSVWDAAMAVDAFVPPSLDLELRMARFVDVVDGWGPAGIDGSASTVDLLAVDRYAPRSRPRWRAGYAAPGRVLPRSASFLPSRLPTPQPDRHALRAWVLVGIFGVGGRSACHHPQAERVSLC